MTQITIILLNLLVLCLGGHVFAMLKYWYKRQGIKRTVIYSILSTFIVGSGAVLANTYVLQIADVVKTTM